MHTSPGLLLLWINIYIFERRFNKKTYYVNYDEGAKDTYKFFHSENENLIKFIVQFFFPCDLCLDNSYYTD